MIFISPPFGNYLRTQNTISIKGSFTLHPRPGLFSQIFKTLHYSFNHNGWVNSIGLRNPGIDVAIKDWEDIYLKDCISSWDILYGGPVKTQKIN